MRESYWKCFLLIFCERMKLNNNYISIHMILFQIWTDYLRNKALFFFKSCYYILPVIGKHIPSVMARKFPFTVLFKTRMNKTTGMLSCIGCRTCKQDFMQCCYNTFNFSQNTHNRWPIARYEVSFSWVQVLICFPPSLFSAISCYLILRLIDTDIPQ